MEKIFSGKTAVVTGGRIGIGRGIAAKFASLGCGVAIYARGSEAGKKTAAELTEQYGVPVTFYTCDVTDEAQVKATVAATVRDYGKIDFLVNNAGIYPAAPFLEMETEQFSRIFDINVKGLFLVTREVVQQSMKAQRFGKIVSMSSVDSWLPTAGIIAYAASKAAVNSLVKSFAIELQDYNITSNGVAPGWVATEPVLKAGRWKTQIDSVLKKRMADVEEIADIVAFLCEDRADYMNGEVVNMSGGLLLNA
ncbi:MAG: SDR family NAD(P)-dependent oxidoreductase [Oscillospiraceae bacterium]